MKKSLFFFAAAALALTACTSEDDILQTGQTKQVATQEVGFDVYVPGSTNQTRSGRPNVITTGTMQETGFGVFAYQTDNEGYTASKANPNFMWNQQVNWNNTASGWYYAPLKYWPNETTNDSQSTPAGMNNADSPANTDKLTLLAYAPWVSVNGTTGKADQKYFSAPTNYETRNDVSIIYTTNNAGKLNKNNGADDYWDVNDAKIWYKVATNPNQSVDLLWGVAPVGGLTYTSVAKNLTDGTNIKSGVVSIAEGMPLVDLIKPAVNTTLKFQFQHALARLGVKVVAAVDQVAAGGKFDTGNSKITIESIKIYGNFATQGILDLKNTEANTSLWLEKTMANNPATAFEISKIKVLLHISAMMQPKTRPVFTSSN